jgi:hypothetical protein
MCSADHWWMDHAQPGITQASQGCAGLSQTISSTIDSSTLTAKA